MLHVEEKWCLYVRTNWTTLQKFISDTQLLCELSNPFLCTQISFSFDSQGWAQF